MASSIEKPFSGRTAVISGGLGDIGRAIARALAERGASVSLGDLQPESEATEFLQSLQMCGVNAIYYTVDASKAEQVRNWIDDCEKRIGAPDIIIANAATVTLATLQELTMEQWDAELRVNLNGPFYLGKIAAGKLIAGKRQGHMVVIGSWAAHVVHAHIPAYSVSKAGLRMLAQCLALELAPHGILVNEIAPGYVDAGLSAKIWATNPELREQAASKVPVRQLISPDEVAAEVVHLCRRENRHITGTTLLMDGGLSLGEV